MNNTTYSSIYGDREWMRTKLSTFSTFTSHSSGLGFPDRPIVRFLMCATNSTIESHFRNG